MGWGRSQEGDDDGGEQDGDNPKMGMGGTTMTGWGRTHKRSPLPALLGTGFKAPKGAKSAPTHLAGPEDDPVLVLGAVLLVVLQLLPLDADGHGAQLLVHPEVVGVLCEQTGTKEV